MEDTTAPSQSQRQKRSRGDDEAGDTGAARGSSRLAAGIDDVVAEEKKPETLFIQEEEQEAEALMDMEEPDDRTPPNALREINFFYVCRAPPDGGGAGATTARSRAADQEPVDVALPLGGTGPLVARREDTVDATLRLGLGPHSAAAPDVAAALGKDDDDDLRLHLHGVPFSASPAGPKLDPTFCYPLPFADDPCHGPPPSPATPEDCSASPEEGGFVVVPDDAALRPSGSTVVDLNQPCSSEFPADIAGDVVDERPGRETAEQRHQCSTPYIFI